MKHSEVIFNRDLYNLTYNDLEQFFQTQKDESLNLEFKSFNVAGDFPPKENAIKKAVCGLLNSEGGVIIWGSTTEQKDANGNTFAIGELTPFQSQLDRDRLINILSSSITPLPVGIRVQVLKNHDNLSVFVIEVEKSIDRPHQYDNRYYIRLDGQTRIAPHYLISALMKSTNFPVLRGHLRLKEIQHDGHNIFLRFTKLLYNTSEFNNDINVYEKIIATPGHIFVDNILQGGIYNAKAPIISNGAPLLSNFTLRIPSGQINQEINLIFQFGGEKSPSKMSTYKYQMNNLVFGSSG